MTFDRYFAAAASGVHGKIAASNRPVLQMNRLSPGKKFRIHYDTSGSNLPAMVTQAGLPIAGTVKQFVDSVATIFDSVWTAEVTTYGFAAPPVDNGEGGGDEFDIYIRISNKMQA